MMSDWPVARWTTSRCSRSSDRGEAPRQPAHQPASSTSRPVLRRGRIPRGLLCRTDGGERMRRVALIAFVALSCGRPGDTPQAGRMLSTLATAQVQAQTSRQASSAVDATRRTAIVEAAQRVSSSVVSITVDSRRRATPQTPWDFFFLPQGQVRHPPRWHHSHQPARGRGGNQDRGDAARRERSARQVAG